jgi:3-isopropylmalate dehydrogenase
MANFKLFLLPGDGIGPEVMAEAEKVIDWFGRAGTAHFEVERGLVGGCAYEAHGAAISDADMARAASADAVLLGAVGCACARTSACSPICAPPSAMPRWPMPLR